MNKYEQLVKEAVKDASLMDNEFMNVIFDRNPAIIEEIVNTVMKETEGLEDIKIDPTSIEIEDKKVNLIGHSIINDVALKGIPNIHFILEIQKEKEKFTPKRGRYYSSMHDTTELQKGEEYEKLNDIYIIVFVKGDVTGHDLAVGNYTVMEKEHHYILNTGINYIFINTEAKEWPEKYNGIKSIAEDIVESNPEKIHSELIKEEFRKVKNLEEDIMENDSVFNKYYEARWADEKKQYEEKQKQFEEKQKQNNEEIKQLKAENKQSKIKIEQLIEEINNLKMGISS